MVQIDSLCLSQTGNEALFRSRETTLKTLGCQSSLLWFSKLILLAYAFPNSAAPMNSTSGMRDVRRARTGYSLKVSLRYLGGLCVSAVMGLEKKHRRDAENAEI